MKSTASILTLLLRSLILLHFWKRLDAVIHSATISNGIQNYGINHFHKNLMIHKVSLTQKGYIQFLRYVTKVPPLTDYTFCIWVRSNNLTYSHPLLSYSKDEDERLIRVWISPLGKDINLEILQQPIFKVRVNFIENHWYHVCQSWSSDQAAWNFYLNGKLKAGGFEPKMKGVKIKGQGDIVVGQEYTDFDKGLDDGIEGDVFGFNFILSSSSGKYPTKAINRPLSRRHLIMENSKIRSNYHDTIPVNIYQYYNLDRKHSHKNDDSSSNLFNYFDFKPINFHRSSNFGTNRLNNHFASDPSALLQINDRFKSNYEQFYNGKSPPYFNYNNNNKKINDKVVDKSKPLGLRLVELSYNNCALGKGSPVSGKEVLISWTKTPVRVFGGAILKTVPPFCT